MPTLKEKIEDLIAFYKDYIECGTPDWLLYQQVIKELEKIIKE